MTYFGVLPSLTSSSKPHTHTPAAEHTYLHKGSALSSFVCPLNVPMLSESKKEVGGVFSSTVSCALPLATGRMEQPREKKLNFETSSALFETFEADKKGNELTRKKARIKPSNCATAYDGDDRHLLLLSTCSLFLPELHLLSDGRRCFLGYCCLWTGC